jgi:glucose-6-phosphate 1-dehydrogenase
METREAGPTILVIFGVTGDLSKRYLLPALTEIYKANQLPEEFEMIGVSRRKSVPPTFLMTKLIY